MPLLAPIPRRAPADLAVRLVLPLITGLVWVRAMVPISTDIYWDVDPRSSLARDVPVVTMGAAGLAWLNMASLAAAALGLAAYLLAGGAVRWGVIALAAAGSAACVNQMPLHADNLHRGASWLAAIWLGVAVVHLAERAGVRRFLVATLIAGGACLAIDAVRTVTIEHPEVVRQFLATERDTVHSFGWEMDSPQHLSYRRRVLSAEVTGAFGLSNVFGSIVAAAAAASLGAGWSLLASGRRRAAILPLIAFVLSAAATVLSRSKGAGAALLMAAGLLAVVAWVARRWAWVRRVIPAAVPLLAALAICAVIGRGELGPPKTAAGERSLFFRSQYFDGAARMLLGAGSRSGEKPWLTGVGPAEFRARYPAVKASDAPEDIASTHNVLLDWTAMLGLGGAAWSVLLLWQSVRAGRGAAMAITEQSGAPPLSEPGFDRSIFYSALTVAAVAFGTDFYFRAVMLDDVSRLIWAAQAVCLVMGITVMASRSGLDDRGVAVGLWLAAAVLLVHGQIEMTVFHWGSAVLAVVFIAAPGAVVCESTAGGSWWRRLHWIAPLLLVGLVVGMVNGYMLPVSREESALAAAAEALQKDNETSAIRSLITACEVMPSDPRPRAHLIERSVDRANEAMRVGRQADAVNAINEAIRAATDPAISNAVREDRSVLRAEAQALEMAAVIGGGEESLRRAAGVWRQVVERAPYGLRDRLRLAELLWRLGETAEARRIDEESLGYNDAAYIDPVLQLQPREIDQIKARLAGQ
ncbi:MAG: hypothetical protein K8S99_07130 [Planctomycetes bacterium]|nr:hypothetical protein [Planctomycetota bacterium]